MAQALAPPSAVNPPGGPPDEVDSQSMLEQSDERIAPKAAIPDQDIALGQVAAELGEQGQFGY
ncbi:MAG TPA: hypothetical protein PKW90_25425, partial [Myxococcota bacterium]|nr:hypothetical protein [Myxococcota bacterium]